MIIFIKNNKIISFIAFVSTVIVVGYSLSIDVPEWWHGAGQLLEVFYQLSIGYLISFSFYILQVYLPELKKQERALEVIRTDVNALSYDLLDIIFTIENCATIETNELNFHQWTYYFKRVKDTETTKRGYANKFEVSKAYIEQIRNQIDVRLHKITSNSLYGQAPLSILESISVLQSNKLFSAIIAVCEAKDANVRVSTGNIKSDFTSFKKATMALWNETHEYQDIPCELSPSEIAYYSTKIESAPPLSGRPRVFMDDHSETK